MSTNSLLAVLGAASLVGCVLYAICALWRRRSESIVKTEMSAKANLKPFLSACLRYHGPEHAIYAHGRMVHISSKEPDDEAAVLRFYATRVSQCPNPYVAATEEWIDEMGPVFDGYTSLRTGGGEAYFGPGVVPPPRRKSVPEPITDSEIAELIEVLRFDVICDFVLEGKITREEGERYFGRLAKMLRKVFAEQKVDLERAPSLESVLENRRVPTSTANPN